MESAGFEFLISDLDLALTLTQIAMKSGSNAARKKRNQRNARRAYDTVQQLANRIGLTGTHRKEFDRRLEKLRSELRKLGEEF